MSLRYTLLSLTSALILLVGGRRLHSQILLSPIELTNRPLNSLNDASATAWNPAMLGVMPSGYEVMAALPFFGDFDFQGNYALFGKGGPIGIGIISPPVDDTLPELRNVYHVGFGFPLSESFLWFGGGVRWYDGGGFFKSGEYTIAAMLHPFSRMLTSITLENLTANNSTGIRFNALAAYRPLSWATLYAGARYDKFDTVGGHSALRTHVGASISVLEDLFQFSAQYDPSRSTYRLGLEMNYAGTSANTGLGSFFESGGESGLQRGVMLARYSSVEDPIGDGPWEDDLPVTGRNPRGWAPGRAYIPVGLQYKFSTNDAQQSGDALIRPCDGSGLEFDTPNGLMSVLPLAGKTYAGLTAELKRMAPNPRDLYKVIRQEYYTTRVKSRELRSGDSLALLSRQGYSIGVQGVNTSAFPKVSVLMQVTDGSGRNVRGLGASDFRFRDSSLKILSVRPIDSSFNVPVDIVMIVDCSGSMRDEIQSVRVNVESFVNSMQARGADYRIGGVMYGAMIYDTLHPTYELETFKAFAKNADAIGTDEITSLAIKAATEMNFRPGAQRVFILITDDWQIQDNARLTESDLVEMLWNTGARLYTIGNICSNNGSVMTRLSLGREYNITQPFNSILDDIGADVTTLYELVYESRLKAEEAAPRVTVLRGRVRDETGRPASVPIRLSSGTNQSLPAITPNPTTGEYETEIVEGVSYTANVSGDRYIPLTETVDLRSVARGDTIVRDFTLKLPPTTVAGRVTDEQGRPVGAEVRIEDMATGERLATVRSGGDGAYETRIEEGRAYRMVAINPDYIPNPADLDLRGVERGTKLSQDLTVTSIETAIATGSTFKVNNIFFDFAKWDLKPESYMELDRLVSLLNEYPTINVEIGAHTDAVGSDRDNQSLSQNRARSVVEYLIAKGIVSARLRARGYGESVPIATNDTDEGRALNRRVEFKLVR